MTERYVVYETITKELLDTVNVGDLILTNDSKQPLRVYGVSPNYFVMARRAFGQWLYSVCEKKPWEGIRYNSMVGGMFHIGTDNFVFGNPDGYDFTNPTVVKNYLDLFESGETELSLRRSVPLTRLAIKRTMAEHDPLKELTGLAADVNVNEISDQIRNGTLAQWIESWQMQMALELENCRLSATELEKLRRENFGLKTTVNNLRAQVDKFYRHR